MRLVAGTRLALAGTRLALAGTRLALAGTRLALVYMMHYPVTLLTSHGTGEDPCR